MVRVRWWRNRLAAARRPALERDERVVAWAEVAGSDQPVVVTNLGLWTPGAKRVGWHEIHKVTWTGRDLAVVPAGVDAEADGYVVATDLPAVRLVLPDPRDVPDQVRTRVTRSVAYTSHHRLDGGGVRVVARRIPGVNGLSWAVRYDPGVSGESLPVADVTAELVRQAKAGLGPAT
jgi:hypothetical protein